MATATSKPKAVERIKMRIRKGDTVQVIAGKDKGKTGAVLRTLPNENRVIVEGVNMRTRHDKKVASRVEIVVEKDGTKKRKLKKTGEVLD